MNPQDRLTIAATALAEHNPDNLDAIDDISPEELAKISADYGLKEEEFPKLIGTMIYIRKRLIKRIAEPCHLRQLFQKDV